MRLYLRDTSYYFLLEAASVRFSLDPALALALADEAFPDFPQEFDPLAGSRSRTSRHGSERSRLAAGVGTPAKMRWLPCRLFFQGRAG